MLISCKRPTESSNNCVAFGELANTTVLEPCWLAVGKDASVPRLIGDVSIPELTPLGLTCTMTGVPPVELAQLGLIRMLQLDAVQTDTFTTVDVLLGIALP